MTNVKSHDWRFALLLMAGLVVTQLAIFLEVESLVFTLALVSGGLFVTRYPAQATWVGFFLLAVASQIYPVQLDELGTSLQGAFRPFILVLVVVAVAMLIGPWVTGRRTYSGFAKGHKGIRSPTLALIGVLLLALFYSYFWGTQVPELVDVVRECSGWLTFLVFLALGLRLSPSFNEMHEASKRLNLSVLTYSAFFVTKYLCLSQFTDPAAVVVFGYSQRDVVFFSGVVLAVVAAQSLAPEVKPASRGTWLPATILLLAAFLCGARSVIGSVVLVTLSFILVWRARTRLRLGLLVVVIALVVLVGPSLIQTSFFDSKDSLLGSLTSRFLSSPTEDASFLARASEMVAVAEAIQHNPFLGRGMLASYSFFDPNFGWKDSTFLDTGLGYLLMKTGLLGTGIFLWFAGAWLKMVFQLRKRSPAGTVAPLATFVFYLVFLPFGPSFFEFQHSWFIGLVGAYTMNMACCLSQWNWGTVYPLAQTGVAD